MDLKVSATLWIVGPENSRKKGGQTARVQHGELVKSRIRLPELLRGNYKEASSGPLWSD